MARGRRFVLSSGLVCEVVAPVLPLVRHYYVVHLAPGARPATPRDIEELWALAHQIARQLAAATYADPECFSLLFNAARTRRQPWPHIHILLARSTMQKRWGLICLSLKHVLRWWRWPLIRTLLPYRPRISHLQSGAGAS